MSIPVLAILKRKETLSILCSGYKKAPWTLDSVKCVFMLVSVQCIFILYVIPLYM